MKKFFSTILFFGICMVALSQPSTPVPDARWGLGGTKTVTTKSDPNTMEHLVVIEYKDDKGFVRERVTWRRKLNKRYTRESEIFTQGGRPMCKVTDTFDDQNNWLKREGIGYRKDGQERVSDRRTLIIINGADQELEKELDDIEAGKAASIAPVRSACGPGTNCQPKTRYFLAYSYLNTMTGGDNESFPLGAHASFIYNATSHIGLGLDASIHTKTIDEEKLTRGFLLAEGKYTFGNTENCDRPVIPDLHILAGLGCEKYGTSKSSGFAFGAGGGLDIKLSKKIALSTQVDFIGVKFKGADDLNSNIRASAGLAIRL